MEASQNKALGSSGGESMTIEHPSFSGAALFLI
jgi:hypothetical protein